MVIIGTGGSKFADIAVDDISLIKGTCDRRAGMYCSHSHTHDQCLNIVEPFRN